MARIALIGNLAINVQVYLNRPFSLTGTQEGFPARVEIDAGGSVVNHAKALAALSSESEIFSLYAPDDEGQFILRCLRHGQLSTAFLRPLLSRNNRTVLLVNDHGEKKILGDRAPLPDLATISDAFGPPLRAFPYVHISPSPWTVALAVARSQTGNVSLSADYHVGFDLSPYSGLVQRLRVAFFSAVGEPDVPGKIAEFLKEGPEVVVCSDGENGCYVGTKDRPAVRHYPAIRQVEPIVDTVGAGDVFAATFLHFYYSGSPLDEAVLKAHLQAGRKCTRYGVSDLHTSFELQQQYVAGGEP